MDQPVPGPIAQLLDSSSRPFPLYCLSFLHPSPTAPSLPLAYLCTIVCSIYLPTHLRPVPSHLLGLILAVKETLYEPRFDQFCYFLPFFFSIRILLRHVSFFICLPFFLKECFPQYGRGCCFLSLCYVPLELRSIMLVFCAPVPRFCSRFRSLLCTTVVRIHTQGLLLYWTHPPTLSLPPHPRHRSVSA